MSKISIFLLDNINNTKEEANIKKPKNYGGLLNELKNNFKDLPDYYETFIVDKNNEEIEINNDENYNKIEDILFIREIDEDIFKKTLFERNYNRLSESKQEKFEQKYNCILCMKLIKNENPYLCYICQTIFHEECLKKWDIKCKSLNKILSCPECRNELQIAKWNKKLDYEENRKDNANLMNKINEYKMNNNMNININIIKDKKINELNENKIKQNELIVKYGNYIEKSLEIFRNILSQINSIHILLKLQKNNQLNNLINQNSLNIQNLDDISSVIKAELKEIKLFITNFNNKRDISQIINKNNLLVKEIKEENKNNNLENHLKNNNINKENLKDIDSGGIKQNYKDKINIKYYIKTKGNYDIFGEEFVKNNKDKIELIINGKKNLLMNKYNLKTGKNTITLKIKHKLTNLSYMFYWCKYLKDISDLEYLDVSKCDNFSYMFYNCLSLSDISSLENWNFSNCVNFEYMFYNCSLLSDIRPLQNWNVSNGINFEYMFYGCSLLSDIKPLENWNISNGIYFEGMFSGCSSLSDIAPLSNWNISEDDIKKIRISINNY